MISRRKLATVALLPWASAAARANAQLPGQPEEWIERGIDLDVPRLAETGNSVPVSVRVDAALGEVAALHLWLPKNPSPHALKFEPGPRALPRLDTRVRLARSQQVTAVAALRNGKVRVARAEVIVTLGACAEEWLDEL